MTNKFSQDIHAYLTEKIEIAESKKKTAIAQKNSTDEQRCTGQLHELNGIRRFLTTKFDLNTQTYY